MKTSPFPGILLASLFGSTAILLPLSAAAHPGTLNAWLQRDALAASNWDIGGHVRVRFESTTNAGTFANRDFSRGQNTDSDVLLFRTVVSAGWTPASWFSGYVSGRDATARGDMRAVTETDTADLYQAWVQFGRPALATVKLGRQEIIYGDQRYVGNADWRNTGRVFDSARIRMERADGWIEAFTGRVVIPRDDHFNTPNDYDQFSGIYASNRRWLSRQETELYLLARNVGSRSPTAITPTLGGPGARDIYTLGTRWKSIPTRLGPWDYLVELAAQRGRIDQSGRRLEHRAYAFNTTFGRTWKDAPAAPRLGLGYDFGSGDADATDHRNGTFELLFGTNHRLYGNMDLVGLRNMHIGRIEAAVKPSARVTLAVEYLDCWLVDARDFFYPESGAGRSGNGYERNANLGAHVGQELNVLVDWRTRWGLIRTGAGRFFAGDYIAGSLARAAANRGAVDASWFYLQASANF